ncbi:MAG: helix-turn-helix transcriptional regulator, partial [Eubacteriales bacterium]|nr:helix-turn-helix transcriptional regulator [Eubacteriales bacterium]
SGAVATSGAVASGAAATLSERLLRYVQAHFTDSSLSLMTLADEFHLSPSYVTRLIKQESGKSFTELLNQYRLEHASRLLTTQKDLKLWAVADACGFSSQHYFSRIFKQETGYTPAEYRKLEP